MKNSTELFNDKLQEGVSPSLATIYAGLAELQDAYDLGSYVNSCGLESHIPHQKSIKVELSVLLFLFIADLSLLLLYNII